MKRIRGPIISLVGLGLVMPVLVLGKSTRHVLSLSSVKAGDRAIVYVPSLTLATRLQQQPEFQLPSLIDPTRFVADISFNDAASPNHILVFCFHDFGAKAKLDGIDYPEFEAFVQHLKDEGYQNLTTQKLIDFLYGNIPFQGKWVLYTFDDGLTSQIKAAEILSQHGYSALFNIISNRVLVGGHALGSAQIKSLLSLGHELGSHTSEHCKLTLPDAGYLSFVDNPPGGEENCDPFQPALLTKGQVTFQLKDSKAVMEKHFGVEINSITYPYGFYNDRILEESRKAGYVLGFRAPSRVNRDVYRYSSSFDLPRIEVHRHNFWSLMDGVQD